MTNKELPYKERVSQKDKRKRSADESVGQPYRQSQQPSLSPAKLETIRLSLQKTNFQSLQNATSVSSRLKPFAEPAPLNDPCLQRQRSSSPITYENWRWSNWGIVDAVDNSITGSFTTKRNFDPSNVYEIASAIIEAEADHKTVRALGSGWSFSDASLPQETPTTNAQMSAEFLDILTLRYSDYVSVTEENFGYSVSTSRLNSSLQAHLPSLVADGVDTGSLFFVEAGILLSDLNLLLDSQNPRLALKTMGGSAGQTLAGATSTGTHGSDFDRPPLSDSIRAMYIVGQGGTHHWVDSYSKQVSEPEKIHTQFPCIDVNNCHYSDEMLNACRVAMGSMGIIYAMIIDVVPQYALAQLNYWGGTWEKLNQPGEGGDQLSRVAFGQSFANVSAIINSLNKPGNSNQERGSRALQIVINPIKNDDGTHNCYQTIRLEVPLNDLNSGIKLPAGTQPGNLSSLTFDQIKSAITSSPDFGLGQATAFAFANIGGQTLLQQAQSLIKFCKSYNYYWAIRAVIDLLLQKTFPNYIIEGRADPQVDIGYKVMANNVYGQTFAPLEVTSIEIAFPFKDAIVCVGSLLNLFDASIPKNVFPAGYLSLRACGSTSALLGMEQFGQAGVGSFPDVTGTIEISLLGNADTYALIPQIEQIALSQGGILHWGQSNGLLTDLIVREQFPKLNAWKGYQAVLGGRTFTNLFMQRCGLT